MSVKRISAKNPSASLIFLHGLGDTGDGWSMLAQEFNRRPDLQHINLILPTAPTQYVSGFQQRSTSWFDIKALGSRIGEQNDGFFDSIGTIKNLIHQEIDAGIPANRIVVGGFSQGAALSIGSLIALDTKLSGFISHSGFLSGEVKDKAPSGKPVNVDTPVLMIHGKSDDVVSFKLSGEPVYKVLKDTYGISDITWRPYDGLPHTASLETINDIMGFLQKTVPKI